MDLGFKGFDKQFPDHLISMPQRKPRTKDLSEFQKDKNKKKSGTNANLVRQVMALLGAKSVFF